MATPTFTKRDMVRQSAKVWAAVKRHGCAVIKSRNGDEFTITAKESAKKRLRVPDFAAHYERLRRAGWTPLPPEERERFNRIIAGEE